MILWLPDKAPSGPVSIVVSDADKQVSVLRNGELIGAAPVTLATPIVRPAAYSLQSIEANGRHWMRLPLAGQDVATPSTEESSQYVSVDPSFEQEVIAAISPGTTVLLTPDSMTALASSTPEPVIESAAGGRR